MLRQVARSRFVVPVDAVSSVWLSGIQDDQGLSESKIINSHHQLEYEVYGRKQYGELQNFRTEHHLENAYSGDDYIYQYISQPPYVQVSGRNLARLRAFRGWSGNWDGEGAPAPDIASLGVAERLLSLLAYEHPVLSVGLDADSRPMFNLRESVYEGHIVVETGGELSFSFYYKGCVLDGFYLAFDGRSIPQPLKTALSRV